MSGYGDVVVRKLVLERRGKRKRLMSDENSQTPILQTPKLLSLNSTFSGLRSASAEAECHSWIQNRKMSKDWMTWAQDGEGQAAVSCYLLSFF